jgi:glycosyltransferase involved in cell wall biosynthesis
MPSPAPYSVSRFAAPRVRQVVADWISQRRFDVAVCDFLASTLNFPRDLATPTALFQHNVESLLWSRRARFEENRLERWISRIESAKMARYEPAQVRRFHHVLAVSEQDRHAMAAMVDPARISVIPTGVDLAKYRYNPEARATTPLVVFTGSMDWAPNIDGVEYFCRDIWPSVLEQVPDARFRIVGRDPHARVQKLASASVEVTGTVPSIVDHLGEAAVVVVPLRIGGGTRIKIYVGMAMGKATVSTALGAEGLDVRHGHDILLADDPQQFADYVVRFLCDEHMRRRYEAAAAATAQKYDWSVITEHLIEALHRTVGVAATQERFPSR